MYNTKDCKDKKESCFAFIGFVPDFTSYGTIASVLLPPTVASNIKEGVEIAISSKCIHT